MRNVFMTLVGGLIVATLLVGHAYLVAVFVLSVPLEWLP